jgi:hypothetical protein
MSNSKKAVPAPYTGLLGLSLSAKSVIWSATPRQSWDRNCRRHASCSTIQFLVQKSCIWEWGVAIARAIQACSHACPGEDGRHQVGRGALKCYQTPRWRNDLVAVAIRSGKVVLASAICRGVDTRPSYGAAPINASGSLGCWRSRGLTLSFLF